MSIAPISGLSTYSPVASVKPLNYAITNDTAYSKVFEEEATKGTQGVNATSPVRYPDAQLVEDKRDDQVDLVARLQSSISASKQFNSVAQTFEGAYTGYSSAGQGTGYGLAGATLDLFA